LLPGKFAPEIPHPILDCNISVLTQEEKGLFAPPEDVDGFRGLARKSAAAGCFRVSSRSRILGGLFCNRGRSAYTVGLSRWRRHRETRFPKALATAYGTPINTGPSNNAAAG